MSLRVTVPVWLMTMICANVAFNRWSAWSVVIGLALTGGLALLARWAGFGLSDLGLARSTRMIGLRWGCACVAAAACGYGVALLVPAVRNAVNGPTGSWTQALIAAFVTIPLAR